MEKGKQIIKLPKGWLTVKLEDISKQITDGSHNPPKSVDSGIPMLSARNIKNSNIIFDKVRYIAQEEFEYENRRTKIEQGDVLLTIVATIGRTAVVPKNIKSAFTLQRSVAAIKPLINSDFLMYCFQSPLFQKQLIKNAKGTAQKGVYLKTLRSLEIPLAPLKEQQRIVSKIESLFSEFDHAINGLKKAKQQLQIYRHALLKYAFEGKLTEDWRNDNQGLDANSELLSIKKLRKNKYNEVLNEGLVKKPKVNFNFVFKFNKDIPSWADANLDNLIGINARIGWRGLTKKEYTQEGALFLSVHSLNYGKNVVFKDVNHITIERYEESPEIKLRIDDILLCKDGAGIGKVGIIKNLPSIATVNSSLLVINSKEVFNPDFLYYFFLGPTMQKLVNEKISGSAIPHLFQKDIKKFNLKVPPKQEQNQIVEILESRFTIIENLEKSINNSLSDSIVLRHSILKKAFDGNLINQDSSDESARELLLRIKQEKEEYLKTQKELDKLKSKKKRKMETKKTVLEILKEAKVPISTQELWANSVHEGDIESFYSEIKEIHSRLTEIKEDNESLLSLKK
jgi:type I restriction enzyme S subunit